ncbi:MAG: response regulator [Sandaracinaceae bacterium]|nr:response regulator [Sandaracinaceae bacterium]MBK6810080.1 response regulator [Sandaracinaceae bacterium]MBK7153946.1 response regulator [Sandaracinaceae bacterium]MBK7776416.1 response regulator [Sandaracinaceae bacterium]MBK8408579.1 response regulator [Sandaracinaceae bacterium]
MKKILLVEDDALSSMVLGDFLEAHGYDVSFAKNGVDALTEFERVSPDAMLVDVMLPKRSGFEVCFEVKRTEKGRNMPVMLMSAVYRDEDHARKYAREDLRAQAYLVKLFDMKAMLTELETLLTPAA